MPDRTLKVSFSGNPAATIMSIYSPTNLKDNETINSFHETLRMVIKDTPSHEFLAILGNWNVKISKAHLKYAHNKLTSDYGMRMLDLSCEQYLCICE